MNGLERDRNKGIKDTEAKGTEVLPMFVMLIKFVQNTFEHVMHVIDDWKLAQELCRTTRTTTIVVPPEPENIHNARWQ